MGSDRRFPGDAHIWDKPNAPRPPASLRASARLRPRGNCRRTAPQPTAPANRHSRLPLSVQTSIARTLAMAHRQTRRGKSNVVAGMVPSGETNMTPDLKILVWSVALTFIQVLIAAATANQQVGLATLAGNREHMPELTGFAGRANRAHRNMLENL